MRPTLFAFLFLLLTLSGCYSKQVRHLASEAALITPGQTTVKDVQKYLGEPDNQREIAPGLSEFVYYADQPGLFGNTPILNKMSGPAGYQMIILTIDKDIVTNSEFREYNASDLKWTKDFTWEEVK